jgi:hypothetical protein
MWAWFVKKVLVEFLWDKLMLAFDKLIDWLKEYKEREKIVEGNDKQAAIVEAIAEELKKAYREQEQYLKAGQLIPEELDKRILDLSEKLKIESRKLSYRADVG